MVKKILSSRRGEGYIDIAVSVIAIALVLAVALSIFQVIAAKTRMDRITEDLIECATYEGSFGKKFEEKVALLQAQYGNFEVSYGPAGDSVYYNTSLKRIQLGGDMYVTVTIKVNLLGAETVFPMELNTTRVGKSEQYWQGE